jgi:L-amino acid N-acyltransferase YncA
LTWPVALRPARAADAAALARILGEGIDDRIATFETRAPTPAEVEALIAGGALVLVAERDGVVVGFAKVGPYSDPAPYYAGVGEATVYVAREARGAGAGRLLLEGLAREAQARGYWKLIGKIFDANLASLELVHACGWREVGVHRRHGRLDGEWKDVVVVELSLGETRG